MRAARVAAVGHRRDLNTRNAGPILTAPPGEALACMLQHVQLTKRRFKYSRPDERVTLADFDRQFKPKLPRQACFELRTLKFVGEGANVLITGKTRLATALGIARLTQHAKRVRFYSTVDPVNALSVRTAKDVSDASP